MTNRPAQTEDAPTPVPARRRPAAAWLVVGVLAVLAVIVIVFLVVAGDQPNVEADGELSDEQDHELEVEAEPEAADDDSDEELRIG